MLPSLGESDVVFMTPGDLVPGLHVTAEDAPEAARLKGSLKILDVLAAAIADRQRLPEQPLPIELADVTVRIDAETAEWAREEARASGLPHNEAREVFVEIVTYVLTERAMARIGEGWLTREDRDAWEQLRAELRDGARGGRRVHRRARRALADPDAGDAARRSCTRHRNGCARRAPTSRCGVPTARPGRCRTCRCWTS